MDQLNLFPTEPDWDHVRRELPPPPPSEEPIPHDPYVLKQANLLDQPQDWEILWKGMPQYNQENQLPWQTVRVHFRNSDDRKAFAELINQKITDLTLCVWHPKFIRTPIDKLWVTEDEVMPLYPIYIVSKGRWKLRQTSHALEEMKVPYRIVVEPQEYDDYAAVIDPQKILTLPFSNLGQGSIPARNWIWEHSVNEGHAWHWVVDDNINDFYRLHQNIKYRVRTGATFRAIEEFANRYENCVQAGMNYHCFALARDTRPPFLPNTRIYSCILLRNDLPFRWRGRYNEDTDLSIRILKAGYCTALFNAFVIDKSTTMTTKGGNTDELYVGDGRWEMAESLREQHPDVVRVIKKWGRNQHFVNYKPFQKANKFKPKEGVTIDDATNDFGMGLIPTSRTNYFEVTSPLDTVGKVEDDDDADPF